MGNRYLKEFDIEIGTVFARLTVIDKIITPSTLVSSPYIDYMCKCECGTLVKTKGKSLRRGNNKSCGCLLIEARKTNGKKNKLKEGNSTKNAIVYSYKRDAKKRNLEFNLNSSLIDKFFKSNCYYCGALPSKTAKYGHLISSFTYNGIDRIDNNVGYIEENCVPCCIQCNKAKLDMTLDKFLVHVVKIHSRMLEIRQELALKRSANA